MERRCDLLATLLFHTNQDFHNSDRQRYVAYFLDMALRKLGMSGLDYNWGWYSERGPFSRAAAEDIERGGDAELQLTADGARVVEMMRPVLRGNIQLLASLHYMGKKTFEAAFNRLEATAPGRWNKQDAAQNWKLLEWLL